ncbi:uncharacterized protein L201_002247 [Kwoniella dendrophila CBS 6074]|uniref:Uncharacterized protein n=1 Tax=Kwoniella dendrophila CBS 6074 TaxID=1295534 RepID=A0AAX4JS97_9TREE
MSTFTSKRSPSLGGLVDEVHSSPMSTTFEAPISPRRRSVGTIYSADDYADDEDEGEDDPTVYTIGVIHPINLGPRPIYKNGKWSIAEPDLRKITYELQSKLDQIHEWKYRLTLSSKYKDFRNAQDKIDKASLKFSKKTISLINKMYRQDQDDMIIQTSIRSWNATKKHDSFKDIRQTALMSHDIIPNEEVREDILYGSVSNLHKPSVLMVVGNRQPTNQADSRVYMENGKKLFIEVADRFDTNWDLVPIPSNDSRSNAKAESSIKTLVHKAKEMTPKTLDIFNESTARFFSVDLKKAPFGEDSMISYKDFDVDQVYQVFDQDEEQTLFKQYEELRLTEEGYRIFVNALKEEYAETFNLYDKASTDSRTSKGKDQIDFSTFDIIPMSGYEFYKYDPELARSYGYLDWSKISATLQAEIDEIKAYKQFREEYGFDRQLTQEERYQLGLFRFDNRDSSYFDHSQH